MICRYNFFALGLYNQYASTELYILYNHMLFKQELVDEVLKTAKNYLRSLKISSFC